MGVGPGAPPGRSTASPRGPSPSSTPSVPASPRPSQRTAPDNCGRPGKTWPAWSATPLTSTTAPGAGPATLPAGLPWPPERPPLSTSAPGSEPRAQAWGLVQAQSQARTERGLRPLRSSAGGVAVLGRPSCPLTGDPAPEPRRRRRTPGPSPARRETFLERQPDVLPRLAQLDRDIGLQEQLENARHWQQLLQREQERQLGRGFDRGADLGIDL